MSEPLDPTSHATLGETASNATGGRTSDCEGDPSTGDGAADAPLGEQPEGHPEAPAKTRVVLHTDGACRGNPGPGGWGALLSFGDREKKISGFSPLTTNNRMELLAAIHALASLSRPCQVRLTTDSSYVKNGITQWIHQWKKRGWRKAGGKPVLNVDLWRRLEEAADRHVVEWVWTRGHAGDPGNEAADRLATSAIDKGLRGQLPPDPAGAAP